MDKLGGDILIGFGDFFDIGAAKKGKPQKKGAAPGGGKGKVQIRPYSKPPRTQAIQRHGKVLSQARGIALKAAKLIGRSQLLLAQKPKAAVAKPLAKAISGKTVHVGAAVVAKMSPKAQLAVKKHNAAVAKSKKAAQLLAQHALKTKASVKNLAKKMVAQKKTAKVLRTPASRRRGVHVGHLITDPIIGEAVAQAFQDYYTAVGQTPDPNNPGFLTDGSPDPAAPPADAGATDAAFSDMDLGPLTEDPLDSGAELPPAPDMSVFIPDMTTVGGIAYDGSKGTPDGFAGSLGLFTKKTDDYHEPNTAAIDGTAHFGYVFGKFDHEGVPNGIPWGAQLATGTWNHVHGRKWLLDDVPHEAATAQEAAQGYKKMSPNGKEQYGPVVGNPGMKDFVGMRMDGNGNLFWLPQEAPDWLTFPIKQAAALTAQAAAKAAKDAAAADAAAAAKASADAAAAQAAQDAANALAESQAASTARVAQAEEGTKQAAQVTEQAVAETQAQQAMVQQQAAETAEAAVETEQMKQAGELVLAQAKRQQAYLAAHPEEEFAPQTGEEDVAAAEEGSLEGETMEDGEPMPGGDIMQDSGGEGYQEEDAE